MGMEIKKEYAILFNTMTHVIKKLESAVKDASNCIQMMKEAQKTAEEMYISETEADSESFES